MPIDPVATARATPDPQAGPAPSLQTAKSATHQMHPDRVEQSATVDDPVAKVRALQQEAETLGSAATAAVGRGLQAATKAAPEIIDGAAARMTGLVGVVLSMPGDVPHDAAHGYHAGVFTGAMTHELPGTTTLEKRQFNQPVALTAAGAKAIADVKSHCDPNDFKSFDGPSAHKALREAINTPPGWHMHHLIGQSESNVRAYGTEAIQNTRSVINLPPKLHAKVNAIESTSPEKFGIKSGAATFRDYVQTKNYATQREIGLNTVRKAMKAVDLTPGEKRAVEQQLDALERKDDFCLPERS